MEWIKISKKTMLLIVGLFIVQALLFVYSVNIKESETDDFLREKDLDYDEEYISEQIAYIDNYNQSLENVINQSQSLGGISIFSKLDSFSESNLEQTRQAFENIIYVEPVAFNDIFIKQFFMYTATNGFILLAGVFIALSLVESKKNGMRILLHCTMRGRKELVLQKLVTLFYCNVIIITVFTVGNIVISAIHFEGDILQCLSYPIQSVSYFSKFVYKLTIGEFMLVYILYKVVIMFMLSAIVWLITYCVDNILFSCGIIGVLGAISYIIYSVIDINHPLNFLRYCNFWYLLKDASVFMEYKNLNWHDKAINKDVFIAMFVVIVIILVIVVSLVVSVKKYPINSWSYKKIGDIAWINKMKLFVSNMNEKLSVTMFEYYKVFIKQKGIIVVLILLYIIISQIDMQEINRSKSQLLYYEFMDNYQGVQNEASEKYIEDLSLQMKELDEEYQIANSLYESGMMTKDEWIVLDEKYKAFESERMFLKDLQEQQEYLNTLKLEKNIDGWYVNVYGYNHLFSTQDTLGNVGLIFAIVLICSGLFSYENKNRIGNIIRGSKEGRQKVYICKVQVAVMTALLIYVIATGLEIALIDYLYGLRGFSAPVQSLYMLRFVPLNCNIGTFVFMMYILKGLIVLSFSVLVCRASMSASKKKILVIIFVLCIPSLLNSIGFTGFENYSIVSVMSIGTALIRTESIETILGVTMMFIVSGIVSLITGYKKWCVT